MISVAHKFPLRTDFTRFRARATRLTTPHTTIYHLQSSSTARMAVIVPKKVNKLATTRNYLKRLTHNTLWPLLKDKNLDCVIVYKPLPLQKSLATTKELSHELSPVVNSL